MDSLNHMQSPINSHHNDRYLAPDPSLVSQSEDLEDDIKIRDILSALKRRLLPFLGVAAFSSVLFILWILTRPPLYQRQFSMAVEPLDRFVSGDSSSILGSLPTGAIPGISLPGSGSGTDYNSLMTVLQSELVLAPVVQAGQTIDPEFDHEKLTDRLSITQIEGSRILEVAFEAHNPDLVQQVTAVLQETFLEYSTETQQMAMIRRLNDLNSQVEVQRQEVARAQASLLRFQGDNQILDLKTASEAIERRRGEVLLEQQSTRLALNATLEKYNTLQRQLGLDPEEAFAVANLSESPIYQKLLTEYRDLESQIALQLARFREDTPIIQALRDKQNQLRPLLQAEAERNVGESLVASGTVDPQTLGYQGTVGRGLVAELVSSVNEIQMLDAKDRSLSQLYNTLSTELDNLVKLGGNFREVERNLALTEAALQGLLAAQQQLKLDLERDTNPWLIVSGYDLTTPLEPESQLLRNIVLGVLFSSISGLSAVFILERLDRSYRDSGQLNDKTGIPVLASIPFWQDHLESLNRLPISKAVNLPSSLNQTIPEGRASQSREQTISPTLSHQQQFETAFHKLGVNLRLLGNDTPVQVVAIASSLVEEGKSTVSAHLAAASANMGRKVLLVNCAIDQMPLGNWLKANPAPHLSRSSSPEKGFDFAIQPALNLENLDLLQISSHSLLPPTQAFSDLQLGQNLKNLRAEYDLIILDTPTSLNGAEAKLISQYADALLLVVKIGKTAQDIVNSTVKDFHKTSRIPILGIVANGVELNR